MQFTTFVLAVGVTFGCMARNSNVRETSLKDSSTSQADMEYVTVCKSQTECKKFSRLIMGTDHLAQADWTRNGQAELTDDQVFAVLDEAAKLGINFFDTAPIYVGNIENRVGRWMSSRKHQIGSDDFYYNKSANPDRQVYLLSKGGFPFDLFYSKKLDAGTHADRFKQELRTQGILDPKARPASDGSLPLRDVPPGTYASRLFGSEQQITKRVGEELGHTRNNLGDNLTIYLMHRDDGDYLKFKEVPRTQTPVQTIMKALSNEELASHYWSIGWSNWQTDRVNTSVKLASTDPSLLKPLFNSAYFSLFEMSNRSIHAGGVQVTHQEMMDSNFQAGVMQSPYSPLGGFSILDKPEPRWENAKKAAKTKYDANDAYWQNVYHSVFTDANEARFARVEQFTKTFNAEHQTDYTIDQMINAYALAHKRMDFLTIGPITVEQLRRTVGSLKLARMLTESDLEYLYSGRR